MRPEAGDMGRSDGLGGEAGPAGLPPLRFKPRCRFGHGHRWIAGAADSEVYQCADCGCMSSNWEVYDRSKVDPYDNAHGLDR